MRVYKHCLYQTIFIDSKALRHKIYLEQSNAGWIFKRDAMTTHKSYKSYLIESLKDPAEAAAYLEAVLEDGKLENIVLALKNVTEARRSGGDNAKEPDPAWKTAISCLTKAKRQNCDRFSPTQRTKLKAIRHRQRRTARLMGDRHPQS
jgi:hypothetical protein